jgi:hypothetical protein
MAAERPRIAQGMGWHRPRRRRRETGRADQAEWQGRHLGVKGCVQVLDKPVAQTDVICDGRDHGTLFRIKGAPPLVSLARQAHVLRSADQNEPGFKLLQNVFAESAKRREGRPHRQKDMPGAVRPVITAQIQMWRDRIRQ